MKTSNSVIDTRADTPGAPPKAFTSNTTKCRFLIQNKPETAKVGAISKAQNCKRDPLGFVKPVACKISKKH